jgi:hypothetical protein
MNLDDLRYEEHEDFNQSLDDERGLIKILNANFRPSEILFALSKETYRIALTDYQLQQTEDFKDIVYSSFPTPIAYYFRQVHFGYLNNNNRLHLLRSTWEACIFFLYAIVVSEARKKRFPLRAANIRENDIYHFSLDRKINIIERVLLYNRDNNLMLKCGELFDLYDIVKIKELNYKRNV